MVKKTDGEHNKRSGQSFNLVLCNKVIHEDIVAETASHDKQMEDFMIAEAALSEMKQRNFKCIDNTSDCINQSACQKPHKCSRRQR